MLIWLSGAEGSKASTTVAEFALLRTLFLEEVLISGIPFLNYFD
jgi:hypothetical protein